MPDQARIYLDHAATTPIIPAAREAMAGRAPLDGPLWVGMVFTVAKPKSAPKRKRTWPATKPDLSKLARSTEDALSDGGAWRDDAMVVEYLRLAKVYPGEDANALHIPGAVISIYTEADMASGRSL